MLAVGKWLIDGPGIEYSISSYYYTGMRDVFVGTLIAMAMFLLSYHGYALQDHVASDLAGLAAIGVALLPTTPDHDVTRHAIVIGHLHYASAVCFFLAMVYFCFALFRRTDKVYPTPQKLQRNRVYSACGYTIILCLAAIAILLFVPSDSQVMRQSPVFWLETTAVEAFGIAWLTKGEAILRDRTP